MRLLSHLAMLCCCIGFTSAGGYAGGARRCCPPRNNCPPSAPQLANTIWVVPQSTLLAYFHAGGSDTATSDQTVWVIDSANKGYFFGTAYPSLNGTPSTSLRMVGSLTPLGDVYITYYPTSGSFAETQVVDGIGRLVRSGGQFVFIMQMNSSQNPISGLSHWSYMVSVTPSSPLYKNLPGVNMSVPDYIAQF